MSRLTADQVAYVRQLREQDPPVTWDKIAAHLSITRWMVQASVIPGYLELKAERSRRARERNAKGITTGTKAESIPEHVARLNAAYDPRRDGYPEYRRPFSELLGEPPIGRSALDMRGREC